MGLQYIITAEEIGKLLGIRTKNVLSSFNEHELIKQSSTQSGIPPYLLRPYFTDKGIDYSCRVIAHINLKGGTGKTTSTITSATRAVQYGFKTCIIDMDSQGSASLAFEMMPEEDDPIFCDVWQKPAEMVMGSIRSIDDNLFILPSSLENGLLDTQLINPASQKKAVRGVCDVLKANGFNLIMIDCPPSLGTAVISTICAADCIVIPVGYDAFSRKGLELTINEVSSICDTFNLASPDIKILYTKFDKRIKIAVETFKNLSFAYKKYFIPIPIRTSTEFAKALEKRVTVFFSTKKSYAKDDYDRYVRYLLGLNNIFKKE